MGKNTSYEEFMQGEPKVPYAPPRKNTSYEEFMQGEPKVPYAPPRKNTSYEEFMKGEDKTIIPEKNITQVNPQLKQVQDLMSQGIVPKYEKPVISPESENNLRIALQKTIEPAIKKEYKPTMMKGAGLGSVSSMESYKPEDIDLQTRQVATFYKSIFDALPGIKQTTNAILIKKYGEQAVAELDALKKQHPVSAMLGDFIGLVIGLAALHKFMPLNILKYTKLPQEIKVIVQGGAEYGAYGGFQELSDMIAEKNFTSQRIRRAVKTMGKNFGIGVGMASSFIALNKIALGIASKALKIREGKIYGNKSILDKDPELKRAFNNLKLTMYPEEHIGMEGVTPKTIEPKPTLSPVEPPLAQLPKGEGVIARDIENVGLKEGDNLPKNVYLHGSKNDIGDIENFSVANKSGTMYLTKNWDTALNYGGGRGGIKAIEINPKANILDLSKDRDRLKLEKILKEQTGTDDYKGISKDDMNFHKSGLSDNVEIGNALYNANIDIIKDSYGNIDVINNAGIKTYTSQVKTTLENIFTTTLSDFRKNPKGVFGFGKTYQGYGGGKAKAIDTKIDLTWATQVEAAAKKGQTLSQEVIDDYKRLGIKYETSEGKELSNKVINSSKVSTPQVKAGVKLTNKSTVDTPEGQEYLEKLHNRNGGFLTMEEIPNAVDKLGEFSLVVKDVNGHRIQMNVSDFQKLSEHPEFEQRIREVFVLSGHPIGKMSGDKEFMKELILDKLLKSKPQTPLKIGTLEDIGGVKLTNKSTVTSQGKEKFTSMITDNRIRNIIKDNDIKEINILPPYKFELSEQAHIIKNKGIININADATDPTNAILHELGHKKFESLSKTDQDILIERAKNYTNPKGINGYKQLGKFDEVVAENLYTNPEFAPDFYKSTVKPKVKAGEIEPPSGYSADNEFGVEVRAGKQGLSQGAGAKMTVGYEAVPTEEVRMGSGPFLPTPLEKAKAKSGGGKLPNISIKNIPGPNWIERILFPLQNIKAPKIIKPMKDKVVERMSVNNSEMSKWDTKLRYRISQIDKLVRPLGDEWQKTFKKMINEYHTPTEIKSMNASENFKKALLIWKHNDEVIRLRNISMHDLPKDWGKKFAHVPHFQQGMVWRLQTLGEDNALNTIDRYSSLEELFSDLIKKSKSGAQLPDNLYIEYATRSGKTTSKNTVKISTKTLEKAIKKADEGVATIYLKDKSLSKMSPELFQRTNVMNDAYERLSYDDLINKVLPNYVTSHTRSYYITKTLKETKPYLDATYRHSSEWGDYLSKQVENVKGVYEEPNIATRFMHGLRTSQNTLNLKLNPAYGGVNLLQPNSTTGILIPTYLGRAQKMLLTRDKQAKYILDRMEMGLFKGGKFGEGFGGFMATEKPNYKETALAWYLHGTDNGLKGQELRDYATTKLYYTMFPSSPATNVPFMKGELSHTVFQYQNFPISMIGLLKNQLENKNTPAVLRWFLLQTILGGLKVTAGMLGGKAGYNLGEWYLNKQGIEKPKASILPIETSGKPGFTKAEWDRQYSRLLMYGISSLADVNIGYRLILLNIPQGETGFEKAGKVVLGPGPGNILNSAMLYGKLKQEKGGRFTEGEIITRAVLNGLGYPGKFAMTAYDLLVAPKIDISNGELKTTGIRDRMGNLIPMNKAEQMFELACKGMGFSSIKRDEFLIQREVYDYLTQQKTNYDNHIHQATAQGNLKERKRLIDQWNKLYPEAKKAGIYIEKDIGKNINKNININLKEKVKQDILIKKEKPSAGTKVYETKEKIKENLEQLFDKYRK